METMRKENRKKKEKGMETMRKGEKRDGGKGDGDDKKRRKGGNWDKSRGTN